MGHPTMQENDTAKLTPTYLDKKVLKSPFLLTPHFYKKCKTGINQLSLCKNNVYL